MKNVYLTAGHNIINGKGNGAFGIREQNGKVFDEALEARKLTDDVIAHLKKWYKVTAHTDKKETLLPAVISWLVSIVKKDDLAIEFHFNAGVPAAHGTEVIIPRINDVREKDFAAMLSFNMADCLGIRNRGVKTEADTAHKSIGILNKPKAATNILAEICFITNHNDVSAYRREYNNLVQTISDTIGNYLKEK